MKKDSNNTNLDMFLGAIAKLYEMGFNPSIKNLYPRVEWPVSRGTQSIGSLMQWDHEKSYNVRGYPDCKHRETSSDFNENIDIANTFKNFYPDHKIDDNIIFPAAGYLMMAWKRLAYSVGKIWYQLPVIFEDVQFRRPVFLSYEEPTKIKVRYLRQSGEFFILENNNTLCFGKMKTTDEYSFYAQDLIEEENNNLDDDEVVLKETDIYKDLRACGYDYGPFFKRLKTIRSKDFRTFNGTVNWDGNWITFTDGLLQTMAITLAYRKLMVPVMIKRMVCDFKPFYEGLAKHKVQDVDETQNENQNMEEWDEEENAEEMTEVIQASNFGFLDKVVSSNDVVSFKSDMPFHVDMDSQMIVTYGIEVECVEGIPIPRKTNFQDLKLESYEFVANQESMAIEETERESISQYLKVCAEFADGLKNMVYKKTNKLEMSPKLKQYLNDIKEDQILLKLLNECHKGLTTDQTILEESGKFITEVQKRPEFDLSKDMINRISKNEYLFRTLLDIVSENNVPKKEIKVFEINLTKDIMAIEVDNHLASAAIYPIDVNYAIAVKCSDVITDKYKNMSFEFSEWDPKVKPFPSDVIGKDLVIIRDSPEIWNLNLGSFVEEVCDAIIDRGFVLSLFRYKYTEPELALNSMNGKKFMNNSILDKRIDEFVKTSEINGLKVVGYKCDSIGYKAVLLRKIQIQDIPPKENLIEIRSNSNQWFDSLKEKLIQIKETEDNDEKVWLIANDSPLNGIIGLINCLRLEPGGEAIRCLFDCDGLTKNQNDLQTKPFTEIFENDLAINVVKNGRIGTYRHIILPKNFDKILSNDYFLNIGQSRDLSSLQWYDRKHLKYPDIGYNIRTNAEMSQIPCNIYASGLNFRDVMLATGRIVAGNQSLFTDCLIGFEFAGRRCDTGERVMGFEMSRCFATSVHTDHKFIHPIPDQWTMEEAVTVLSTYSTVYYALIERAQLSRNESILIHSGAGGVGQAAINVCKYYDCDIFVTVGTEEKKKFLMTEYNIPENRIFSSRDVQFKYRIKSITKGKGVDIVMNSLTGDKLDASYDCVASCGRFVEIGKYDLQMNKQLGMFSFLRDISFIGVSVDLQLFNNQEFAPKFYQWVDNNISNGMVKPITKTVFAAEEADKAFRYMTTGQHIGKIVIRIRNEENDKLLKDNFNSPKQLLVSTKTYFDPKKVYIITGGLGGMGLELIHGLLFSGARNFVVTSRYGVRSDRQKYVLGRLKAMGITFRSLAPKIVVSTHNTNTIEGAHRLIKDAQQMGTIGGIFHLALVLNDNLFEKQTINEFNATVDSKVKTFENLDKISRDLSLSLEYFVVFSSIACGKGNIGQTNYGFGNSICERICEARRKDGLHGLAIQWGPIGDVGLIADIEISHLAAVKKQRINSCLDVLDKLLQTDRPVVSCYVRAERLIQSGSKEAKVVAQIWSQLGVDPKKTPDYLNLGEIGMESIFAIELQEGLERDYGIKIALTDVKYITIKLLRDFESGKVQEMKRYSEELKISRSKLCKYKFVIPSESYTRLNDVKTGKPIYFLPPIDGIFASLEPLAEQLRRPVIGINWLRHLDDMSLKEVCHYFMDLLKTLAPDGNYDVLGTLDNGGALIVKMIRKAPISKALLIDCISDLNLSDDKIMSDEEFLELSLRSFWNTLPEPAHQKFRRDLRSNKDFETKVSKLATDIREFGGKALISKDLDEILKRSNRRAKQLFTYRQHMRKKFNRMKYALGQKYLEISGKLMIIKPKQLSDTQSETNRFSDLYFLPEEELQKKIKLEHLDEITEEFCSEKVAKIVNEFFSSWR